jgi:hypothetical protein
VKHLEFLYIGFYLIRKQQFLWAFIPFFPWNEEQPLILLIHPKIPRDKKWGVLGYGKW